MEKEEVIKRIEELRDSYELHQRSWATKCLNIIEEYVKNSIYKNKVIKETKYLEEDKAIEELKNYIEDDDLYNIYKGIKEDKRQGEAGGTHIDFCKAIDTVLNLITKLQKENEEKDQEITKYKNMYKSEHDIHNTRNEQLDRKERGIIKAKQQLIEKDKQIDLMAEYINNIQDCPLENCGVNLDCENRCNNDEKTIKQCWIKYFKKLAKEKGE